MVGRHRGGRAIVGGLAAVLALAIGVAALGAGSATAGSTAWLECDSATGTVTGDGIFASGDQISVGFLPKLPSPRPARGFSGDDEFVSASNRERGGDGQAEGNCGATVAGTWKRFESALGPGDDTLRMDGRGVDPFGTREAQPLPRRMTTLVAGGPGAERIRGHDGPDTVRTGGGGDRVNPLGGPDVVKTGGGPDVVRAFGGGRDSISCGRGRDRAIVDNGDDVVACEDVVVR